MTLNPNLDENDLREKLSYNVGLYITHVDVKDMVEAIQFPKGWSWEHCDTSCMSKWCNRIIHGRF